MKTKNLATLVLFLFLILSLIAVTIYYALQEDISLRSQGLSKPPVKLLKQPTTRGSYICTNTGEGQGRNRLFSNTEVSQKVGELKILNLGIIDRFKEINNNYNVNDLGSFGGLLQQRKDALHELILSAPFLAHKFIITDGANHDLVTFINQNTANCLEEYAQYEGKIEVFHQDFFEQGYSVNTITINVNNKQSKNLNFIDLANFQVVSGSTVRLNGYQLDNELLVMNQDSQKGDQDAMKIVQFAQKEGLFGEQKFLVILSYFKNTSRPAITKRMVDRLIFGESNDFYKENSYSKISLGGKIIGWYELDIDDTCNKYDVLDGVIRAVDTNEPSINFNDHSRLILIIPTSVECVRDFTSGTIGNRDVETPDGIVNMSVAWFDKNTLTPSVISHEIGHNFDHLHANSLKCRIEPLNDQDNCLSFEYGDRYAIMGGQSFPVKHDNANYKEHFGWLNEGADIITVKTSGLYKINPIELPTGIRALKIPGAKDGYLYVEYRQPIGFDNSVIAMRETNLYEGALLHTGSIENRSNSHLISPDVPFDYKKIALVPWMSFRDPRSNTIITTKSADKQVLTVDVQLGKTDFEAPVIEITNLHRFDYISRNIYVETEIAGNLDDVDRVEFYYKIGGDIEKLFQVVKSPPYRAFLEFGKLQDVQQIIMAKLVDNSGDSFGVSNNISTASVTINIQKDDETGPSLDLQHQLNGSAINLIADTEDEGGIWKVEFYKNGEPIPWYTDYESPYEIYANLLAGHYNMQAVSFDNAGNSTVSQAFSIDAYEDGLEDETAPYSEIIFPSNGAGFNQEVSIHAEAVDNQKIAYVEFFIDSNMTPFSTDRDKPYEARLDITTMKDGIYNIKSKAYDQSLNSFISQNVAINIDRTAPYFIIHEPYDKDEFLIQRGEYLHSGSIGIKGNSGHELPFFTEFYLDDDTIIGSNDYIDYSRMRVIYWDSSTTSNEYHKISVKVCDQLMNCRFSPSVTVLVRN